LTVAIGPSRSPIYIGTVNIYNTTLQIILQHTPSYQPPNPTLTRSHLYAARCTPFLKGCSHHLTLPALSHGDKICETFPVTNLAEIGP
jgi:hypothetical protein